MKKESVDKKINLPDELKKLNMIPYFGFAVISNLIVAGLIGYYLDKFTFKNNVIFIVFLCLGLISGIYNGIKEMLKEIQIQEKKERENGESQRK